MLTAVAETSYLFIRCKVKINKGEMLPIKEGTQKIKAINLVWKFNKSKLKTLKTERKERIENVLKIIALLLLIHLEINAVIVPAKAEITAIIDKIKAADVTSILQKSCRNFFPITL